MWTKVLEVVESEENLIYCSLEITDEDYALLPGTAGKRFMKTLELLNGRTAKEQMEAMVESVLSVAIDTLRVHLNRDPEVLLLRDGPYGVPEVNDHEGSFRR